MNEQQRAALFVEVHRAIEESAASTAAALVNGRHPELTYPPNAGLTEAEREALSQLRGNAHLEAALRKVIADAAAAPLFQLFALLDGVADPEGFKGPWLGFSIVASDGSAETMLHDEFHDTYWSWLPHRRAPWRLDTAG